MATLPELLAEARLRGFLGPGPIEPHVAHALGFAAAAPSLASARALDLGSGGGIPGLVLAVELPASAWVLLDAGQRRCDFLRDAIEALGLSERVSVHQARSEAAGRDPALRATFDAVTARSFGSPAVTAENAAPLLAVGGLLVVSEPPEGADRWPVEPLAALGLVPGAAAGAYRVLQQVRPCPERFPRPIGRPAKRPLF